MLDFFQRGARGERGAKLWLTTKNGELKEHASEDPVRNDNDPSPSVFLEFVSGLRFVLRELRVLRVEK